ncbi:MAG TPA: FHA domain-containing protein [Tepidisphaeraceae bacterium]|nr:FHA domain-containing protein [Tepidisphaeraceae bacterium]
MAYIIFTGNGEEVDRRELTGAVTIGRAQDADIPIRDILLSRKHCKLEPSGDGQWFVTDLGSKNGTYIGYRQIARHPLKDGDELRIGRTRVTFRAGAFEQASAGKTRRDVVRPADPTEALAGTVAGFILVEPGEVEREAGAPVPQPRPPEPTSYASEDVYGMLNEIASSSWDSIMAQASRPVLMERPLPRPSGYRDGAAAPIPHRTRVAFSLQAPVADAAAGNDPRTEPDPALDRSQLSAARPRTPMARWWHVPARVQRQMAVSVISAVATTLLVGAWVVAVNRGPRPSAAKISSRPGLAQPARLRHIGDMTFPNLPNLPSAPAPTAAGIQPATEQPAVSVPPLELTVPPNTTFRAAARVVVVHLLVVR